MRLGSSTRVSIKALTKVVGIVQMPSFQHQFLQFLTVLCLATQASASIVEKTSVSDMTHKAKEIRMGEVVSTWTSPDDDQKMYFTYVKVKVDKTFKGKDSQEILLRQAGGSYHNPNTGSTTHQRVFGVDTFQKGDRALFFITHANDGAPTVMFGGKNLIEKDEKTGLENVVHEKSGDIKFVGKNASEHHEHKLFAEYDKRPLNELVLEVQSAIATEKKGESTRK